jgi:hypothetical protein
MTQLGTYFSHQISFILGDTMNRNKKGVEQNESKKLARDRLALKFSYQSSELPEKEKERLLFKVFDILLYEGSVSTKQEK